MATKHAVRPASSERPPPPPRLGDIRSGRPWLLSAQYLRAFVRRVASVASLVLLDLCGLTLGIYAALVIRELYHGADSILWGVLWRAESDWLPFLGLVTVLVFWRAGLYAERGHRANRQVSIRVVAVDRRGKGAVGRGRRHIAQLSQAVRSQLPHAVELVSGKLRPRDDVGHQLEGATPEPRERREGQERGVRPDLGVELRA